MLLPCKEHNGGTVIRHTVILSCRKLQSCFVRMRAGLSAGPVYQPPPAFTTWHLERYLSSEVTFFFSCAVAAVSAASPSPRNLLLYKHDVG